MNMRTATETRQFLKKAAGVASYYGFAPVDVLAGEYQEKYGTAEKQSRVSSPLPGDRVSEALAHIASRAAALVSEEEALPPRLFYHIDSKTAGSGSTLYFTLAAFGVAKSIAEAVIIKTTLAILEENGESGASVYVNSMGDSDSGAKFIREAGAHLKKHAADIPAPAREALKSDVFRALHYLAKKNHPAYEDIPKPMEFLSNKSRQHLSEFLEYLETVSIPYSIDNRLLGHEQCYRETVFEIRTEDEDEDACAVGGRCDELLRALLPHKETGLVGATMHIRWNGVRPPAPPAMRPRKPKVYLIQVGLPARMKSLGIVDTLRQARIPLALSFEVEGLRDQLDRAHALNTPYAVIIGQREALDESAIIRNLDTQAQETVPLASLPERLKTL